MYNSAATVLGVEGAGVFASLLGSVLLAMKWSPSLGLSLMVAGTLMIVAAAWVLPRPNVTPPPRKTSGPLAMSAMGFGVILFTLFVLATTVVRRELPWQSAGGGAVMNDVVAE